jgi:high-affinity Fe2+/Pb2+ permease
VSASSPEALLLIFRVERTPLIAVSFVMLFTLVATGRRTSPGVVAMVAMLIVALVAGLGVLRLASSSSIEDKRYLVSRLNPW